MSIDWAAFTPWQSLLGGALIGLAAVVLLVVNGRVFGISGILTTSLFGGGQRSWRIAALIGVLVSPWVYMALGGQMPQAHPRAISVLIIAGLLVGFGSALGSGCTSGHGVCGISRLSGRSMIATLSFMITGFATVYLFRHLLGII
ncbi:YeeE/YedE family protein [uncultured Paenalcaligenes sp.]|uniref:YeeE/YedE family protein n=1 Tax=uncultured Paenalcaligenes sp. TaxID=1588925 RepID=UPI00262C9E8D|nr:YeeE/YedE family protein [uncultured Paenalcaligenes sp.]